MNLLSLSSSMPETSVCPSPSLRAPMVGET
jgi:hypothetical protein